MTFTLGIDIGGSHCRVGLVSPPGKIEGAHSLLELPTPPEGEPAALAHDLSTAVAGIVGNKTVAPRVGVALPGIWDRATGIIHRAVNLPKLDGVNVRQLLEQALQRPVLLEIDCIAATWAQWSQLRPSPRRFVYLSIGTGIGGGVILDGQVVRHTRGGAGHFGHLIVDTSPDAPVCRCGAPGCLEAVASGAALNRLLYAEPKASRRSGEVRDPDVNKRAVRALAIGLLNVANLYAPDVIALGGGVVDHDEGLVAEVVKQFHSLACTLVPAGLAIERAPLFTCEAGVIGAAMLAQTEE